MVRKERRREAPNPMIQKVRSLRGTAPAGGCVGPVYPSQPLSVCLSVCPSDQEVHEGAALVRAEQQR